MPLSADPTQHHPAIRAHWLKAQQAGRAAQQAGSSPVEVARYLADQASLAAVGLFEAACAALPKGSPEVALVGLGGLGRREMAPFSDLDLCLVCAKPEDPAVAAFADALFYPLWDAGLEVGHALRSPAQFAQLVRQDETARTAAIDCRGLAGSAALLRDLTRRLHGALQSQRPRKLAIDACAAWAGRSGADSVFELQPDVKAGPGGLRELHRLWWLTRLLFQIADWGDLVDHGLADAYDVQLLRQGHATLLGIRLGMHYVGGKRVDQLRFELQDEVAAFLGMGAGEGGRLPGDLLLHQFYVHAQAVRGATGRILERVVERLVPQGRWRRRRPVDGFALIHGRLALPDRRGSEAAEGPQQVDLSLVLRLLRVAQRQALGLHASARSALAAAAEQLEAAPRARSPEQAAEVVDLLTDVQDAGAGLNQAFALGLLPVLLPAFARVRGLTQRDLYHVHTVDAHLVCCATCAIQLVHGSYCPPGEPPAHLGAVLDVLGSVTQISQVQLLVLAALLHDVGKGQGGDHSEVGAHLARKTAADLHLAPADAADLEWLVRHHLTLFKLSQRRDLEDLSMLQRLADDVGTPARLDLLLVLSFADAVTTGPLAWSAWKGELLFTLYTRSRQILMAPPADAPTPAQKCQALQALRPADATPIAAWVKRLPDRHLLQQPLPRLLQQFDLCATAAAGDGVGVELHRHPPPGGWELLLCGPDRSGLLGEITGVLAAHAVSIDAAQISGTLDGQAIDSLVLRDRPVLHAPHRAAQLVAGLRAALLGLAAFGPQLAERQKAQKGTNRRLPPPRTRIHFEAEPWGGSTVVDVYAADRIGLLHDISRALHQAGVGVVLARINTEGERAIDAFYLQEVGSGAPLSAGRRVEVEAAIRRAVEEKSPVAP
jgi:[protein-PII] uridylyltransferase